MDKAQLEATFDQQSSTYDQQWVKLSSFRDGIHVLVGALFSGLPRNARILCVGAGTGAEIHFLAERFPGWTFVAVEPSSGMVHAGKARAGQHGYGHRCVFHHGYLDSLPESGPFDAATCFLVSQFILDEDDRRDFFSAIADQLKPHGVLASSDLASDVSAPGYEGLLKVWLRTMAAAEVSPEHIRKMREAYARDVAILSPRRLEAIIGSAGFTAPIQFYQAGLIHAFYCRRLGD
jgi:tRNA (cmo5U34)-methyltransferase